MIVPDNDDKAAAKLEESRADAAKNQAAPSEDSDRPPDYSEIGTADAGGPSGVSAAAAAGRGAGAGREGEPGGARLPPNVKPTNFVALNRTNEAIKGVWAIDPGMFIPPGLLPPLEKAQTEDSRPNLSLKSWNGAVNVDVYVVAVSDDDAQTRSHSHNEQGQGSKSGASSASSPRRRVIIHASSKNGSVASRIREIAPTPPSPSPSTGAGGHRRLPLHITQESHNGRVTVHLPRAFEGPVRAKTLNGSVKYSASVEAELTRFSDVDGVQRAFIGHFAPAHWVQEPGAGWEGDELSLESRNGSIYINYVDDLDVPPKPKTGFFSRLFG